MKSTIALLSVGLLFASCIDKEKKTEPAPAQPTANAQPADVLQSLHFTRGGALNAFIADNPVVEVSHMAPKVAKKAIDKSRLHISLNDEPVDLLAQQIQISKLATLVQSAEGLQCGAATRTLVGVKISYGLDGAGKLKLYYVPVKFKLLNEDWGPGGAIYGRYELCDSAGAYTYEANAFNAVQNIQTMYNAMTAYQNALAIARNENGTDIQPFKWQTDIRGDVRSLIFSLDQLLALQNTPGNNGNIKIWNAAGKLLGQANKYLIKHLLLVSSDDVVVNGEVIDVTDHPFSDLSHICPPSCNGNDFIFATLPAIP